ncbi:MAG: EamA family transporter [Firmicutes bacterium]|nr:EamA family transporter [Bacillota bacterium]
MNYIILIFSVMCAGIKSTFSKVGNRYLDQHNNIYSLNFYLFLVAWLVILVVGAKSVFPIHGFMIFLAIFYALFTLLSILLYIKATQLGSVLLSSLIYSCGFLVPTVVGILFQTETMTLLQLAGIMLMLISFGISAKANEKVTIKWLLYALAAMFSSGMVSVLQKIYRSSPYESQMNGFLVIAFFFIVVILFCLMPKPLVKPNKKLAGTSVIIGIALASINLCNLYLSGVMPAVIVFPVLNGGVIISSALFAWIFLKEPIPSKKKIGIVLAIIAILLIA